MAEETTTTTTEETETTTTAEEAKHEETVPFDRFQQVNRKAKEAADGRKAAESEAAKLRQQLEDRESAGLPEVEQMKKRLEAAEKRAEENERKANEAEASVARASKDRWVTAAAQAQNFADPTDASAFLNLDDIEDEKDAERAVKRLATAKKHLVKAEGPTLPGRVLENGKPVARDQAAQIDQRQAAIDQEAESLMEGLRQTSTFQRIAAEQS